MFPKIEPSDHDFLVERGWTPTGEVTYRSSGSGCEQLTWWRKYGYKVPQFLALSFERLGWVGILRRAQQELRLKREAAKELRARSRRDRRK